MESNTMRSDSMNRTQKRVVVPPTDQIVQMGDAELGVLRADLVEAQQLIEAQIAASKVAPVVDSDWLIRSNGALAHFRRGLAAIKAEQTKRNGGRPVQWAPDSVQDGFEALDVVRSMLKAHKALVVAVQTFLDDDSDENFAELERLVEGA